MFEWSQSFLIVTYNAEKIYTLTDPWNRILDEDNYGFSTGDES
jgi:hypothetical protein